MQPIDVTEIALRGRKLINDESLVEGFEDDLRLFFRGVNHCLEISENSYKKSEISYAYARNPFEK